MNLNEGHRAHAREVADAIEAHADRYDQRGFFHGCGTPACVAGWSVAVRWKGKEGAADADLSGRPPIRWGRHKVWVCLRDEASSNLGLGARDGDAMFGTLPCTDGDGVRREPTAAEAAAMLRRYADTGEVVWG